MKGKPFSRSLAIFQILASIASAGAAHASDILTAPEYHSRGKGKGKHSTKCRWSGRPTMFRCNETGSDLMHNGERETARRFRHIQRGILKLS